MEVWKSFTTKAHEGTSKLSQKNRNILERRITKREVREQLKVFSFFFYKCNSTE